MLKTAVLLNIFVETMIDILGLFFFFGGGGGSSKEQCLFEAQIQIFK